MPEEQPKREYFPGFDWLRLFLALEVVWLHIPVDKRGTPQLVLPINPVPAFVAISGFLIFASLKRTEDYGRFWASRALRVLPAFFVSILATFLIAGSGAGRDSVLSYVTLQPVIHHPGSNFALWSLLVEELLYLALVILFECGFFATAIPNRLAIWISFVGLALFAIWRIYDPQDVQPAYFACVFAFLLGTFMVNSDFRIGVQRYWWAFASACFLAAGSFYLVHNRLVQAGLFLVVNSCGPIAVVGFGTKDWKIPRLKVDISYGIYVFHLLAIYLIEQTVLEGFWFVVAAFALTISFATASAYLIERPALAFKKRLGMTDTSPA